MDVVMGHHWLAGSHADCRFPLVRVSKGPSDVQDDCDANATTYTYTHECAASYPGSPTHACNN